MHNKIKRGFLSRLFISYTPRVHMQYRNITGVDNLVGFGRFKNQEKRKSIVSLSPSATLRLQELIADCKFCFDSSYYIMVLLIYIQRINS